jgi:hypothetical protein
MKILVHLMFSDLTGVNTFMYTVISKLYTQHRFTVYIQGGTQSVFTEKLLALCDVVFSKPADDAFDQIWLNYYTEDFAGYSGYKKQFVHGTMNEWYKVSKGVDKVYVFSERAFENVTCKVPKILIRNGVDVDRFKPARGISDKLTKIVINDSRSHSFVTPMVLSVAQHFNAYTASLGTDSYCGKKIWATEDVVNTADLVIGYGRSAYEAMAMGKAVLIFGIHGGDGLIDSEQKFLQMLRGNCSGFATKVIPPPYCRDWDSLLDEVKKYSPTYGVLSRQLAEKYLDINLYLKEIIN